MDENRNKNLIRCESSFRPKTIILAGNGVVIGGWERIIEMLRRPPFRQIPVWADDSTSMEKLDLSVLATQFFCNEVFIYNMARNSLFSSKKTEEQLNQYDQLLERIFKLKASISEVLGTPLPLRSIPHEILAHTFDDVATITINWDTTLWECDHPLFKRLIQLHGRAGFDESIVLPLEQTAYDELANIFSVFDDDVHLSEWRKACLDRFGGAVCKKLRFREDTASEQLRLAHSISIQWLEVCERIFVWGIGFNDYDAEIVAMIRSVRDNQGFVGKSIVVLNPDPRQHSKVAELFGMPLSDVSFIDPDI